MAKRIVEPNAEQAAKDTRSERSALAPGLAVAQATPPMIGKKLRLRNHGACLPVATKVTSVAISGSVALMTVEK